MTSNRGVPVELYTRNSKRVSRKMNEALHKDIKKAEELCLSLDVSTVNFDSKINHVYTCIYTKIYKELYIIVRYVSVVFPLEKG